MTGGGATVVAAGGSLQIGGPTGNHTELLDGRTLSNGGTATWIGSDGLAVFEQKERQRLQQPARRDPDRDQQPRLE